MKKINLIYIAFLLMLYALFRINMSFGKGSAFFYGFAENKEVELNHDEAVLISKILVTPGQEVSKGQLLIEVSRSSIGLKIDNAAHDLQRLEVAHDIQRQNLQNKLQQVRAGKQSKVAEIQAQINTLESKIALNQYLLEDLQSVDAPTKPNKVNSPSAIKLATLKENLQILIEPFDIEIAQLESELRSLPSPGKVEMERLKNEIQYYETEQNQLAIYAPKDGLIGNINCKEGENISAFTTLIDFYERHPTMVKGFVHESLIPEVNVGDKLQVVSSLHPDHSVAGTITGLGTRIVEIPERLRKMPEVKTYGREVLIRIPPVNPFLQKEKVMLNTWEELEDHSMFSFLLNFSKSPATKSAN